MDDAPPPSSTTPAKAVAAISLLLALAAASWTLNAYKKLKSGVSSVNADVAALASSIQSSAGELSKIHGEMAGVTMDMASLKFSLETMGHATLRQEFIATQAAQAQGGFVLLAGDGMAEGLYIPSVAGHPALNGGMKGAGMADIQRLLEKIPRNAAVKMVVIHAGINDATRACACPGFAEKWESALRSAVDAAISLSSGAVALSTILPVETEKPMGARYYDPSKIAALNAIIRKVAAERKIILIDNDPAFAKLYTGKVQYTFDGANLNERGYGQWRENMKAALAGAIQSAAKPDITSPDDLTAGVIPAGRDLAGNGSTLSPVLADPPSVGHINVRRASTLIQASQIQEDYLLITGDSITEQLYLPSLAGYPVINAGFAGGRARDVLDFLLSLSSGEKIKAIVIAVGVNDAWSAGLEGNKPEHWRSVYLAAVERAKILAGDNVVLSAIIPPEPGKNLSAMFDMRRIEALNGIIRSVAREKKVVLVDNDPVFRMLAAQGKVYTVDGIHLNNLGFATWRESLQTAISTAFGGNGLKNGDAKGPGASTDKKGGAK